MARAEARCGGWCKVLIAWANGFLTHQEFMEYTQAQKVLRGIA